MPEDEPKPSPAGFWVRAGALLIDSLVLTLLSLPPLPVGLVFLAGLAYWTFFTTWRGQTPGKMAAGIMVVTMTGEPLGLGRSFARAVSTYLASLLVGLGHLLAALPEKRALHDRMTGTRVVHVDGVSPRRKALFAGLGVLTFVLMLVAVAAQLNSLGVPDKFKLLMVKKAEGRTLHNLASLRLALISYSKNNAGRHPATLEGLIGPSLPALPPTELGAHPKSNAWTAYGADVCFGADVDDAKLKDTGGWGYIADPRAPCAGFVFIDCTHPDTRGKSWPRR